MMKKSMFVAMALVIGACGAANAALITEWNFNGESASTVPGGALSPTPSTGAGTASLVGGVTAAASFSSGVANGGSSDPETTAPPNYGWQTTTYPAQGTNDKTAGTQYAVSTVGYKDIVVEYDLRHSNTSSRYELVQYSTDGINFIDAAIFDGPAGDTWFNNRVVDLSSISGVNDNPNFAFRVVATFAPDSNAYAASSTNYATTGTWRFDMVQVSGTEIPPIPEPVSIALFTMGALGCLMFRKHR